MTTPKKSARVRKPKETENYFFDHYWQQYAEANDPPGINVIIEDDCFGVFDYRGSFDKGEMKRLKKLHTWLGKAIKYLEGKEK